MRAIPKSTSAFMPHTSVRFLFRNGFSSVRGYALALFGTLFGFVLLGVCWRTLFRPQPSGA